MKTSLLFAFALLCFTPTIAQGFFSIDQLSGVRVEFSSNDLSYYVEDKKMSFNLRIEYEWDDTYLQRDIYRNGIKVGSGKYPYYLSDIKEDFFDWGKHQKSVKGKYIISALSDDSQSNEILLAIEILEINKNEIIVNEGMYKDHKCKILSKTPAQNGITFKVEDLSKPERPLYLSSHNEIFENLILSELNLIRSNNIDFDYGIVAKSDAPDSLVNFGANSFFKGMYDAYANHRPFVLSPDMIWLLISQGFARHVNANPEDMRDYFVDFSDKLSLIVEVDKRYDDPDISWESVISQFTEQIDENVGKELKELLSCDFSTTTSVERIASEITLMESMKPYFEFIVMKIICGIPEITLQGTPEDWQKVLDKAKQLKRYELDWWISELEPLLIEFVKTSKGEINREFWQNMFKYHTQEKYGAPNVIDGWIVKFFPYDKYGKRNNLENLLGGDNLPEEIVKVDFKFVEVYNNTTVETPMEFWAGFIGLEQNNDNYALTPKIGWMVRKKDTEDVGLRQRLEIAAKNSLSIRVKQFPSILLELEEINRLHIVFINSIDIPDELAKVKITDLSLYGEITDEGVERIKRLFPESYIRINGKSVMKRNDTPNLMLRID